MIINLQLDEKEVDMILLTLAKRPYDEVFVLLQKIQSQGQQQIIAAEQPKAQVHAPDIAKAAKKKE